jgi:NAD(P)-dependent dehydrogenase (short-subunit alcohol dehydrogenase family)
MVLIARDCRRGEAALDRLQAITPDAGHIIHYADLSLMADTHRIGTTIGTTEGRIDVLINNAGAIFAKRKLTTEGLERTFALNHMSYFVLTSALRDRLIATGNSRIVNVASAAHRGGNLDLNDLQRARSYKPYAVYATSKLCNILFTRELARRLAGTGVTANCLHPGFVKTRFGDQAGGLYSLGVRVAKLFAITKEEGAKTIVYLASSPEVTHTTGGYFDKCALATPMPQANDDALARRLWEASEIIAQSAESQHRQGR